jgi:CRISPR-associated helicase Cas3/CRISPR-associated endonuclease Cas3-HD
MTVYAKSKPQQELRDHLIAVREAAHAQFTPARRAAFARLDVGEVEASDLLLSAAWLHDFGKAETSWQERLFTPHKLPQHALSGLLACRWVFGTRIEAMPPAQLALSLAVLAHHGQLHAGSFDKTRYAHQKVRPITGHWRELATELPLSIPPLRNLPDEIEASKICTFVEEATRRTPDLARKTLFRGLYCLLLSLLVEADHAASGNYAPALPLISPPHLPDVATTFQTDATAHAAQTLCALAGCGAGKTAMALSRAARFAEERQLDRIVLCLPTRFTSNSLLHDMSSIYQYSSSDVGLVHSEALMVLREQMSRRMSEEDETSFPESSEERTDTPEGRANKSVRYEHAVTISTVDHLLMSLYHGYKTADRAFGNLLSSLVVFDEVHAYDTTTLNAIREGQNILARYGVPTLFMSATLPSSRRRFFGFGKEQTLIEADNPFEPLRLESLGEPLTSGKGVQLQATDTARQALRESKNLKLAIYVNQVERAKALTRAALEELPETPIFCYHSELAPRDRRQVEEKVLRAFDKKNDAPVVLIATQAAELSLNISAERMITELATADTLVQRAGRLHRRGLLPVQTESSSRLPEGFEFRLQIAPVDLTPHPKKPELIPGALPYKDIPALNRTWDNAPWNENFSFDVGLAWCEIALPDEPVNKGSTVTDAHINDTVFGRRPQENFNGDDNPDGVVIRDIDSATVMVIPEDHYLGGLPEERQLLAQAQVPLRLTRLKAIPKKMVEHWTTDIKVQRNWREIETIAFPILVVRREVCYDWQHGGFDFSKLDEIEDEEPSGAFLG